MKEYTGVFSFDGPLFRDKSGNYYSTMVSNEMFQRFFFIVDRLFVIIRVQDTDDELMVAKMEKIDDPRIKIIDVSNILSLKGALLDRRQIFITTKKYVKDADFIFVRMPSVLSYMVCKICVNMGKKYLAEVGGCAWDSYWNHSVRGKLVAPYMFLQERKYVKKADFLTYVTKSFLQKRYPSYGISTNCSNVYIKPQESEVLDRRIEKIYSTDLNRPVIGQIVGSIDVKYKGEQFFIHAMRSLKEIGIYPVFKIVGPGKGDYLAAQAEKYGVKDQVVFMGAMKKSEIYEWLETIDVYIQPSLQEGLPRAVIEAMSVGCPAVGSDIAGIPELLDEKVLFNPKSTGEIANVIKNVLQRETLLKQATDNFNKAKEYNVESINCRRQTLFLKYKESINYDS